MPSGDQTGAVGSISKAVIRVAVPPSIGMTHNAPCAVNAMRLPSGDGAGAMFVPSLNATVTSRVDPCRLPKPGEKAFLWSSPPQAVSSAPAIAAASNGLSNAGVGSAGRFCFEKARVDRGVKAALESNITSSFGG